MEFLRDNPSINAVFADDIRTLITPVVDERFWVVRESVIGVDLELANLRKVTAQSAKAIERYLKRPDDLDLIHGFRYAFQFRRLALKVHHVKPGEEPPAPDVAEERKQEFQMMEGLQHRFDRLRYGLNIRNLVSAGTLERAILPELAEMEEESRADGEDPGVCLDRLRSRLLSRIRFNENEVFVSDRSTDNEVIDRIYERLVSRQIEHITVYGGGQRNWLRTRRICATFVAENPDFVATENPSSDAWISGEVRISLNSDPVPDRAT